MRIGDAGLGRVLVRILMVGAGVLLAAATLAPRSSAAADGETVLHSFCSAARCADGEHPILAGLIMDKSGHLYGTTPFGGAHEDGGTVFELTPNAAGTAWTETVLHSFCSAARCADGKFPDAGLIMDKSGNLYGNTVDGGAHYIANYCPSGCGTVFELTPDKARTAWTETVLHSFGSFCSEAGCDGENPFAGLIMDKSGNLYGTTEVGGAYDEGTVFELTPNRARTAWTETVLYSFCTEYYLTCPGGGEPFAGLIMDASGNLYGTTPYYGTSRYGGGTVFELTPNKARTAWTETVLYSFCSKTNCADGDGPEAGLIMDASGNLYGTTAAGGAHNGDGTVFELTPNRPRTAWTETVLYSFCSKTNCTDGWEPDAGLIRDASGSLYGTASAGGAHDSDGAVFELTPNRARTAWTETVLYSFCAKTNCTDGSEPNAGLIMDASGSLYGTTYAGGASFYGTVFELKP
jgi:uncharacterized repeat protein (TIGR03803 family)